MSALPIIVRPLAVADADAWAAMRLALFPEERPATRLAEIAALLADAKQAAFAASGASGLVGFIEAGERSHAEGRATSPVAYIAALWVDETVRRRGDARLLVDATMTWAVARGYRELGSDTQIDNTLSQTVHRRLGFEETERRVCFLVKLDRT